MSYVRWSTPIALPDGIDALEYTINSRKYPEIATSDLYIYDHVGGYVAIHVAGNRVNPDGSRTAIDHPDAGESFDYDDMVDAIEKVEQLISEGFLAPSWLIDDMRESMNRDGRGAE
jgi:hypothetical protein